MKLLRTGCLPWQLSKNEFVDNFQTVVVPKAVETVEKGISSLKYQIVNKQAGDLKKQLRAYNRNAGLISTNLGSGIMSVTEGKQFFEAVVEPLKELVGGGSSDSSSSLPASSSQYSNPFKQLPLMQELLNTESLAKLFQTLDRNNDQCLDVPAKDMLEVGLGYANCDTYSAETEHPSDLTLMQDVDNDLMPDSNLLQQLSYSDFCLRAKLVAKMKQRVEQVVLKAAQKCAMDQVQAAFSFTRIRELLERGASSSEGREGEEVVDFWGRKLQVLHVCITLPSCRRYSNYQTEKVSLTSEEQGPPRL